MGRRELLDALQEIARTIFLAPSVDPEETIFRVKKIIIDVLLESDEDDKTPPRFVGGKGV